MFLKGARMTALLNEILIFSLRKKKKFLFRIEVAYFVYPINFFRI